MTTLTTADLVQAVKQSVLSCMAGGDWHNVTELRGQVPDDIAQALCDLSRPIVYGDMPDPLDYGRFTLVDAVLRELESNDGVESRERDDKKEVRLTLQKEALKRAVINDLKPSVAKPVAKEPAVEEAQPVAKSAMQTVNHEPTEYKLAKKRVPMVGATVAKETMPEVMGLAAEQTKHPNGHVPNQVVLDETSYKIKIDQLDPEFSAYIPRQTFEEQHLLEQTLLEEGCRDPLVVWKGHGILLDGHLRWALCGKHDIPYKTVEIELPDRAAALEWMRFNQLARRNVTPEQAAYLRGTEYNAVKNSHGGNHVGASAHSENLKTDVQVATRHGVSPATVRRDAQFAQAVDNIGAACGDDIKEAILNQKSGLTQKDVIALGKKEAAELQQTVPEILNTPKKAKEARRAEAKQTAANQATAAPSLTDSTITVPTEPTALAASLIRELGPERARQVYEALGSALGDVGRDEPVEPAKPKPRRKATKST